MAESATTKLQHAFKDKDDKRISTEFSAVKNPSDDDFEKKPTMAVCRDTKLVYEYKDGASLVRLAVPLSDYNVEEMNKRYEETKEDWSEYYVAITRRDIFKKELNLIKRAKIDQVICTGIGTFSAHREQDISCDSYHQLAELEIFIEELQQ
ncbi:hypothetical protein MMC17_006808 [Xylographa soralifera]|nr:hypothetical protein [Xylographa soralifera]